MSPSVFEDDHVAIAYGMGITAEKVAEQWQVSREDQDAFALASHQRALAAIANGEFKREITPYNVVSRVPAAGNVVALREALVSQDEGPRPDTSAEGLAKLKPVFRMGGMMLWSPVVIGHPDEEECDERQDGACADGSRG